MYCAVPAQAGWGLGGRGEGRDKGHECCALRAAAAAARGCCSRGGGSRQVVVPLRGPVLRGCMPYIGALQGCQVIGGGGCKLERAGEVLLQGAEAGAAVLLLLLALAPLLRKVICQRGMGPLGRQGLHDPGQNFKPGPHGEPPDGSNKQLPKGVQPAEARQRQE